MSSLGAEVIEVRDEPGEHRYVVALDGMSAGFSVYRKRPGLVAFFHT